MIQKTSGMRNCGKLHEIERRLVSNGSAYRLPITNHRKNIAGSLTLNSFFFAIVDLGLAAKDVARETAVNKQYGGLYCFARLERIYVSSLEVRMSRFVNMFCYPGPWLKLQGLAETKYCYAVLNFVPDYKLAIML